MGITPLAIAILFGQLLLGIVFCFFGNRWIKIILAIYGFAIGFLLANMLLSTFTSLSGTLLLISCIAAGLAGAALFVLLLYVGIFFIGFGGGMLLCVLVASVFGLNILSWFVYIPMLVVCASLGALTLNNRRIFVSVFTSFIGAAVLAQFANQIIGGINMNTLLLGSEHAVYTTFNSTVYLVALAALFFAGLILQLTVTSKKSS